MSPGYQREREMPLTHPAGPACLFCHASRIQPTVPGTRNRFEGVPFLQRGVGCERCHGPGSSHVRDPLHAPMVNPARLPPQARDSVCMQCHLEGVSRIALPGRSLEDFEPGDRLADVVRTFVAKHPADEPLGAVSQVEALTMSRCSRESGGGLSCLTCHDPHAADDRASRVARYRKACVTCHSRFATGHHAREPDCTTCHMPRRDSADISHTEVTVHRIGLHSTAEAGGGDVGTLRLEPFGAPSSGGGARELGLAYVEVGPRAGTYGASEALRLLSQAARQHPEDALVLARLAFLEQSRGNQAAAEAGYRRALALDSTLATAAANLGVLLARRGNLAEAIALWRPAFERNPDLIDLGVNLALGECVGGDRAAAAAVLNRVLRFNPDSARARQVMNGLDRCDAG
jgi:predicted CXXCH cytochrome family protein